MIYFFIISSQTICTDHHQVDTEIFLSTGQTLGQSEGNIFWSDTKSPHTRHSSLPNRAHAKSKFFYVEG